MSPELAGVSGLLAFAAAWELAGLRGGARARRSRSWLERRMPGGLRANRFGIRERLTRAGLDGRIGAGAFVWAKLAGALTGSLLALAVAPVAPGRLVPILAAGLTGAGFLAPDAWAERIARRRRVELVAALPDALDLVAIGAAAGRTPAALLAEIAAGGSGPLATELAFVVADIDCGAPQARALDGLRERTGATELGALGAALERSRRYGSPLAEQLHAQASALRIEERRWLEERAARAAPKIQLVVAMVLVPSALLTIAAALVAHSESLFAAF